MKTQQEICPKSNIPAYLLEALAEEDTISVEQHLDDCNTCRHELNDLRPAKQWLMIGVEQIDPPEDLEDRIIHKIEKEIELFNRAQPKSTYAPRLPLWKRPIAPLTGWIAVAATLFVGLAMGGGFAPLLDSNTPDEVVFANINPNLAPDTQASFQQEDNKGQLFLSNLPELKKGEVYKLWAKKEALNQLFLLDNEIGDRESLQAVDIPIDINELNSLWLLKHKDGSIVFDQGKVILAVSL